MSELFQRPFPRFLLVGAGNTLLSLVLMFLLEGLGYWPSTAIAYVAGAVMSFFLNRRFTFRSHGSIPRSALRFALNVGVCYLLGYGAARLLLPSPAGVTAVPLIWFDRLRKLAGMALYTLLNFFGQRFFVFLPRKEGDE